MAVRKFSLSQRARLLLGRGSAVRAIEAAIASCRSKAGSQLKLSSLSEALDAFQDGKFGEALALADSAAKCGEGPDLAQAAFEARLSWLERRFDQMRLQPRAGGRNEK
jgi:hypothetical protein